MPPSGMEVRPLLMEVRSPRAEKMLVAENMRLLQKIDELEKQLIKQQQETLRVRADVDRQGSASASDHWELSMGHAQQALARCFQPRHSPLPTSPQRPGSPTRRQHESLHGRKSVLPDWTSKTEKDLLKRESLGIVGDPFVEKAAKKLSDTPLEEHEYVLEDEWDFTNTNGVINPNSEWKTRWDFIIMFLIIYSAIVVPFRICFSAEAEGIMWNLEVVASFIFIVDVIFNFNTAYFAEEKLVISRPRIVSRYFSGGQRHPLRQRHSLPLRLRRSALARHAAVTAITHSLARALITFVADATAALSALRMVLDRRAVVDAGRVDFSVLRKYKPPQPAALPAPAAPAAPAAPVQAR